MNIVSCPSCARQGFNVIDTVRVLEDRLKHITTPMTLSIIGCVVNGPGEARETDLGFTGGGAGAGAGMIYLDGKPSYKLENEKLIDHVVTLCDRVREVCPELPGTPRLTRCSRVCQPGLVPGPASVAAK